MELPKNDENPKNTEKHLKYKEILRLWLNLEK
jgi:hypothetical protein